MFLTYIKSVVCFTSVVDSMNDGSAECFSLVRAMSDYVQLVNIEKVKNKKTHFRNTTKH